MILWPLLGAIQLLALLVIATDHQMAVWLGLGALALSVVAFVLYAWDKAAARRGARRVAESVLHTIALLGGWPGAALAQRVFRHKTRKGSFRAAFAATVALNLLLAYAILAWTIFHMP